MHRLGRNTPSGSTLISTAAKVGAGAIGVAALGTAAALAMGPQKRAALINSAPFSAQQIYNQYNAGGHLDDYENKIRGFVASGINNPYVQGSYRAAKDVTDRIAAILPSTEQAQAIYDSAVASGSAAAAQVTAMMPKFAPVPEDVQIPDQVSK